MSFIDWLIVVIPVGFVIFMAYYVRRFITGVADYLVCGRVCRRYVLTTAQMANILGLVSLISFIEIQYKTGFALTFWNSIMFPLGLGMSLFGYCMYRFRETRVMSIGQFLEMRYNRPLRIFASFLRSIAEMMANIIMPAIAARFFITYCGIPQKISIFGIELPTFMIIALVLLILAISIIYMGGMLAINVTDTIQGIMIFPLITIFLIFFLCKFSWSNEIYPVLADRVAGESFINPYDIKELRDFNLFMLLTTIMSMMLNTIAGYTGSSNSSISAHESKMANILSNWRGAFTSIFYIVFAVAIITVMNHVNFAQDAKEIKTSISQNIANELISDDKQRDEFMTAIKNIPLSTHVIGKDIPMSEKHNSNTIYFDTAQKFFGKDGEGSFNTQQYKTLFRQLMLPAAMRHMLPVVLSGLFCLMIILFIVSTDDSCIYSASSTLVQDCIVPFFKNGQLSPEAHIRWFRGISIFVGIFFFCGSFFMSQIEYINMFVQIMYGMWLGGCGPMLVFGLYSRFGTTFGAWASLLSGMFVSFSGIIMQRNWVKIIYPWLEANGMVESVGKVLTVISSPFNPYVVWEMDRLRCPINAYEFFFMAMVVSFVVYWVASALTYRKPYNLDRMLHRGIYAVENEKNISEKITFKNIWGKLIGFTPEYSRGDKILVVSVFVYTFIYKFFCTFILVVIWNAISPWPLKWWGHYFLIVSLVVPGIAAAITTVWFGIGSSIDLKRLFDALKERVANPLDNGMVEGHVAISEKKEFEELEKENLSESK